MKKIIGFCYLLFFLSTTALAQGPYIAIEGGGAFPLGTFSSDVKEGAGYAKIGFNGAASVGYKLSDQLSAGIRAVFAQNNPEDVGNIFAEISPWNSTAILGAVKTSYAITEALYIEGEVNGGIMFLSFPAANISIGGINVSREAESGQGLALGAGAGLKAYLAKDFAFKLGFHYVGSKPSYSVGNFDFSQRIDLLLLNFGIVFEL